MQAVDFGEDAEPEPEDAQMAEQAGEEAPSAEGEAAVAGAATTEPAEAAGSAVAQPAEPAAADHPVAAAEATNATAVSNAPAAPGGDAAATDAAAGAAAAATEAEPAAEQAIFVFFGYIRQHVQETGCLIQPGASAGCTVCRKWDCCAVRRKWDHCRVRPITFVASLSSALLTKLFSKLSLALNSSKLQPQVRVQHIHADVLQSVIKWWVHISAKHLSSFFSLPNHSGTCRLAEESAR